MPIMKFKLPDIHPVYIDLIVILLIGACVMLFNYFDIMEFIVPPMIFFYFAGKWVQKKYGSETIHKSKVKTD